MFGLLSNTKIEKIGIHIIEKLALLCAHGVHYTVYTVDFFIAHHHIIITKLPQKLLNVHKLVNLMMASTISRFHQRNMVDFFFNEHDSQVEGDILWRIKKCQQDKKKSGGWTNLLAHLKACLGPE